MRRVTSPRGDLAWTASAAPVLAFAILVLMAFRVAFRVAAAEPTGGQQGQPPALEQPELLATTADFFRRHCVDCHGHLDESPEADVSLAMDLNPSTLAQTGAVLKRALDALESHHMPPADAAHLPDPERAEYLARLRQILALPTLGSHRDPGRPVLRRLTRLEYNNTVRDLLGLETDVFLISERLPFDRSHYKPAGRAMPNEVRMAAREYGARYPVLLPDASLHGDSRAEHGFTNRGDAQNLSAVRLEQYVTLASQIAFAPDLLTRAVWMQELFPEATFEPAPPARDSSPKTAAASQGTLNANQNVRRTAQGSSLTIKQFTERLATAYRENRGGVFSGEPVRGSTIAGKGGLLRVDYGADANRAVAMNPNEDLWIVPFATADESTGDTLMANRDKSKRRIELTFQAATDGPFPGIAHAGLVLLSRNGQSGLVTVTARLDDDSEQTVPVTLSAGAGKDNVFVSFSADEGRHIKRIAIDGTELSGDYLLWDDLAFMTRDAPHTESQIGREVVDQEDPQEWESPQVARAEPRVNRSLAEQPAADRIQHFLKRAFRRPVTTAEVHSYLALYDAELARGGSAETAMRSALHGILASPSFLYLMPAAAQLSPEDTTLLPEDTQPVRPLTNHELAARLSYFLWSTMPDQTLRDLADAGQLRDDAVLEAQVRRMLNDPRSIELSENFFVEWLRLRELWSAQPDREQFARFYSGPMGKRTLAQDMFGEVLLLFQTVLMENRSILDLIDPPFTYLNGKLVRHYQLDQVAFADDSSATPLTKDQLNDDRMWYRVGLADERRGGVLTSAATLTLTSFPHRTSPIRRGAWFLETIYNRPPPPPQIAVAEIDDQENLEHLTLREKVELHRQNVACAVCHNRIDPPGFALENFDAIGGWREMDGEQAIDASGVLAGSGEFQGPVQFKQAVLKGRERYVRGFTEHLLSYALGRKLEYYDTPTVDTILSNAASDDYALVRLITEVVQSYPFRFTRVQP